VGWLVSGILYYRLRNISAKPVAVGERPSWQSMLPKFKQVFPALTWLMLARVFMQVALTTYLPIFMSDVLASSLWLAAASLTILEAAGVVGALAAGTISDRLGRSRVLFFLLGTAPLFMLAFLYGPSWLALPLLIAMGLTAISPQPVFLALVQDEFPDNRALANGAYLAMNFLIRALAIGVVGWLADQYGLTTAFLWSALLVFLSLPAIRYLPQNA
jgi:FSR family fosmidomycin resistance protein-like MFS transporter